jgi:hypothetical protein
MMKRFQLLMLMLALPIALSAFGDTITLKNGTRYTGARVTQSSRNSVSFIDQKGRSHRYAMSSVRSVQIGSSTAPQFGRRTNVLTGGPATQGVYRTLPVGTEISVRNTDAIDSKTARAGQTFMASIDQDVLDSTGALAIPRGSDAELIIENVAGGGMTSGSELELDIDAVTVQGTRYVVATSDYDQKSKQGLGANKRTAEMAGGGAALGALIGAIAGHGKGAAIGAVVGGAAGAGGEVLTKGKEVFVPSETVMTFKLEQNLVLQPAR